MAKSGFAACVWLTTLVLAAPPGERDNYSGIQLHLTPGWLFGRGRASP